MELSPVSENSALKVDLCTPTENLDKQCQEITSDNPAKPDAKPLLEAKKVFAVGLSQRLSKRKLFGQPVDHVSGNENVSENTHKRKRSDEAVKNVSNDNTNSGDCPKVKRLLTERQQLAFLLEATSTREISEHAESDGPSSFTKIKSRKRIKRNGKCVNSRVYRRNERGETPLHLAAIKGDVVALKKLLKDGAEVGVKDYAGWTALHETCNHGYLAAAKLLVKHCAPVNVPGFEGDTPLHDAVVNNHVEVVNMLLSCGANPHQTNMRRRKPTDLISSKEMSDIFNLRGVKHSFQKKDLNVGHMDKTASDNESCVKSSILGSSEIQVTETQGESKMEKPVMYICKLRSEELTMRTTQVTPYKNCSNVEEDGVSETKNITSKVVDCVPSEGQDTPRNEVVDEGEDEVKTSTAVESGTAHRKVKKVVLKDASSLESCNQAEVDGNTNSELLVVSLVSEGLKIGDKETEVTGSILISDQDKVNENTKVSSSVSPHGSEELTSPGSLETETKQINENTETQPPSLASEDPPAGPQETTDSEIISTQLHSRVERSRTPEIDESIAVEVLSGLLSEASQFYGTSGGQQENVKSPGYVYRDVKMTLREDLLDHGTSVQSSVFGDKTSLREDLMDQETSDQSSASNDEQFLDVEGLDPDLKENVPLAKHGEKCSPEQVLVPFEQDDLISSTSNDVDDPERILPRKDNAKAIDYPNSMIVSIPVNEENGFPTVTDSEHSRKHSSTYVSAQTFLPNSYSEGSQPVDTLDTSTFDDQSGRSITSESISLNTERGEKTSILDQSSRLDHNDVTPRRLGNILDAAGRSTTIHSVNNEVNFQPLQMEEKALDKRRKKKVSLRSRTLTTEGGVFTKGNAVTVQQPITCGDQVNSRWEMDARSCILGSVQQREPRTSQSSKESRRLTLGTAVVQPSKPVVPWQSLMAAGRCRLAELRVPGYDQFLMKTKEYELATDANQKQSTEEPAHSTLTEEEKLSLKHEKSKEELLRKQKSEQDKLQLCMEQEMVRFYAKKAYTSLKCNQPPGVCSAIYWQNMSPHQLLNEKNKLSQKLLVEKDQTSPPDHQEIIEKYEKLKSTMAKRHTHEQQSLDAVATRELQSCV